MSVLLISRSEQKLNVVREEILVLYPSVEVEVLVYDFTDKAGAEAFYAKLRGICKTKGEDLGMLVNNVGIVNGVSISASSHTGR
jgi:short-subunit dehydrogenase